MSDGAVTRLLLGNVEDVCNMQEIIDRCTTVDPRGRPRIDDVVEILQQRQLPTMLLPAAAGRVRDFHCRVCLKNIITKIA